MPILYVALAIVLAALGGWFGGSLYGAKDCKADVKVNNAKVEARQAKDDARTAKRGAARAVERAQDEAATAPIVKEIQDDVRANPAPVDCRISPDSVSRLNALVDKANASGGVREGGAAAEKARDGLAGRVKALGR
jgi:hypothetical protein